MKSKIIQFIKSHLTLYTIISFLYSVILNPSLLKYYITGGVELKGAFLRKVKIIVSNGAKIEIGAGARLVNCTLKADGKESIIKIDGRATNINNSSFEANRLYGKIYIQSGFTSEGCYIKAHENKSIKIGADCMFSAGINISTTDFHSILSMSTGTRVNMAKDITIGNHVWLGRNINVLKGSIVDDGIVVGMGSVVSGHLDIANSVYVGSPAKCMKKNITWERELL